MSLASQLIYSFVAGSDAARLLCFDDDAVSFVALAVFLLFFAQLSI